MPWKQIFYMELVAKPWQKSLMHLEHSFKAILCDRILHIVMNKFGIDAVELIPWKGTGSVDALIIIINVFYDS